MEDIVSEFIVGTCRMLPKTNTNVLESMHIHDFESVDNYIILCGSCAEFFIQPLHTCIDDVDYFQMKPYSLAFTDEKPELPYDVRHIADTIDCLLMEPYPNYPAFVQLRLLGQMRYNRIQKTFEYIQANVQNIITTAEMDEDYTDTNDRAWCKMGPANRTTLFPRASSFTTDLVESVWCPQWPNEAKKWPNRHRKYGWPTTAIIHEVVQNGCHVVFAKHPNCRSDVHQCRLSFSVAEVILLQSWTLIQQIVYHMLRFFAKKELIRKDCPKEDEVLCTYHFKTLMLWSCEEMSPEWWNSSPVIELCCILLKKIANWLKETRCPNYFISQANLFHEHFNRKIVDETAKKLIYYCDSKILRPWFVEHYMHLSLLGIFDVKCTQDVLSCEYTRKALKANYPNSMDFYVSARFWFDVEIDHDSSGKKLFTITVRDIFKYSLRLGSPFEEKLDFLPTAEYESCYRFYGSMLRLLHVANLLHWKQMHDDVERFVELIRQVSIKPTFFRSKYHNFRRPLNDGVERSLLYFIKAQDLMANLTRTNDDLEFQVVSEISKVLLISALECEDSNTKTIAQTTLAYMGALHFAASEYQIVINLCSRVIMNEEPENENTETLNACCLLYIEDISEIIGFYLIFRKTRDASLHYTKRQFFLDLRLTPEVFAHHLIISSIERTVRAFGPTNISQSPTFPLDAILMTITNRNSSQISKKGKNVLCVYQRIDPMNRLEAPNERCLPNEDYIFQLLMEFSLVNMTSFYSAICTDFGICCNTADCYHAAYLYRCRKYAEALHLCERILDEPDLQTDLKELAFANVMVMPPLDSYFDSDIQCLLGLHTLVGYLSPSDEDLGEIEVSEMLTFQNSFAKEIKSRKNSLSRFLTKTYSLKCHYFLRRHFLARYLKVRCLIDCNHSLSEAVFEFKKFKAFLPFEHVIYCFLERKRGDFRQLLMQNTVRTKV